MVRAGHPDGCVQGLCPLRAGLCSSPPGQFGIPKLALRTPEPSGSSSRAASSLQSRPARLSHTSLPSSPCTRAREHLFRPPAAPPILPLAAARLSWCYILPQEVSSGPTDNPTPWVFHKCMGLGSWKALRDLVQLSPLTDDGYLGSRCHVACPRPLSQLAAELGHKPKALNDP